MSGGEGVGEMTSSCKSPLEKQLADLTEEDIAQVTREDCRRFLKERGMRRPSWNKSQAIQQVISLKALIEGRPSADDPPVSSFLLHTKSPGLVPTPFKDASAAYSEKKEISSGGGTLPSLAEPSPYRRRDPIATPPIFCSTDPALPCRNNDPIPPDNSRPVMEIASNNQLTIMYDGKINVYNEVRPDKARAVMELAENLDNYDSLKPSTSQPPPPPRFPKGFVEPIVGIFPAPQSDCYEGTMKFPRLSRESVEEWRSQREIEPDCPVSRKASLQRYLEKRKDRFKGKRIIGAGMCMANMDSAYMNQMNQKIMRNHTSNELQISSQPKPPQTPTQNQFEKVCFSFDLNDDAADC